MIKVKAIDAILESAIKTLSESGYEGASLRQIAADAGVSLSTIDAYYGTKEQLFRAALVTVWEGIVKEIDALLLQAVGRNRGQPASLHEVLSTLAAPLVRIALSDDELAKRRLYVIARGREWLIGHGDIAKSLALPAFGRWIEAFSRSCPTLSRPDAVWAYSYCFSAIFSYQLVDRFYDPFMRDDKGRTVDSITQDIATFCVAGVQALIDLRADQARAGQSVASR